MKKFPLPTLTQDQYSTYYGKTIPREDKVEEKIVYPGIKLTCPAKFRNLKKIIKPKHVFITQVNDTFNHRIYGTDNQWSILPKRLHSLCFPKIHLGSIPKNNRVTIQITDSIHQTLPYIPDEFYKQKIQKAEKPSKPVTRRNKRQRTNNQNNRLHSHFFFCVVVYKLCNNTKLFFCFIIFMNISYVFKRMFNNYFVFMNFIHGIF